MQALLNKHRWKTQIRREFLHHIMNPSKTSTGAQTINLKIDLKHNIKAAITACLAACMTCSCVAEGRP